MRYPLKLIEWRDAYSGDHEWFDLNTLPERPSDYFVTTVGFEIMRDDVHVTLVMSITEHGKAVDCFTIPLAMIVQEKTLSQRWHKYRPTG